MNVMPFFSAADVEQALPMVSSHLGRGGLLAYPTETVYGMGSRIGEADLAALATLTCRPGRKPFLVLVAGLEMARDLGLEFGEAATRLAERFWPGPLTLVLEASSSDVSNALRGDSGGIAVRWSSHPETAQLIEGLGFPLSSTSANRSGEDPLPHVDAIRAEFSDAAESGQLRLLDGGLLSGSSPSTLVDCIGECPKILREGAIARSEVLACVEEGID